MIYLTSAESILVEFLLAYKGEEFTSDEIEKLTGIRSDLVDVIMDNLRWKGYDVGTRRGKHFYINNTIWSYLLGGSVFAILFMVMLFSWLGYFG